MKMRALGLLLVATLLAPVPVAASLPDQGAERRRTVPSAEAPLRVMVVGDSLSQGQSGSATYRYWLWRELERQRVAVRFVGPETGLARGGGANLYNRTDHGFQKAHAAHAGSRIRYHLERQVELLTRYRPDLVVLQIGFNDAGAHDGDRIAADLGRYLEQTFELLPETRVVVGEIPPGARPFLRQPGLRNARTARANSLVDAEWGDDERVAIARLRTATSPAWDVRRHTFDGTHPNATGETLMAHRIALALHDLGVLTRPVQTYHQEVWAPAARPKVGVRGRTVTVRLGEVRRAVTATSARAVVTTPAGRVVWRSRWGTAAVRRTTLPPGRYRVRLDVRRTAMSGVTRSTPVRVVRTP